MTGLSLYSGGCDGMSLAASWAGICTAAYCDSDLACRVLLARRHPGIPIFENDEEVTEDALRAAGVDPAGTDIIFGGPPCQCVSLAGKRLGSADPRNRWPQFLRIVRAVKPRWAVAENAPGLLTADGGRLFGDILGTLAQAGYRVGWQCWGAAGVGAPHRRERVFIVAHTVCGRLVPRSETYGQQRHGESGAECGGYVGDTERRRCDRESRRRAEPEFEDGDSRDGRAVKPGLGRDADGLPAWMDAAAARMERQAWPAGRGREQYGWEPPRVITGVPDRAVRLRMIGNSCPPQQYYPIFAAIAAMEGME